jgi:hypothetical protein
MLKSRPFSFATCLVVVTWAFVFAAVSLHSASCTGSDPRSRLQEL